MPVAPALVGVAAFVLPSRVLVEDAACVPLSLKYSCATMELLVIGEDEAS